MYPKTLYGGGAYTVVKNEQAEIEAKARGFIDPNAETERIEIPVEIIERKRGRPRKAA